MNPISFPTALDDLRVLEVGGPAVQYCGKLCAGLGADVLKIEPPEGDPARRVGPFVHDRPDLNRSLSFWHYNTSKRGLTLNLETADGRAVFRRLAQSADVVQIAGEYADWLQRTNLPKLFFYAQPGALNSADTVAWCQSTMKNLTLVDIGPGSHFIQEDNPHLIGRELAAWYQTL